MTTLPPRSVVAARLGYLELLSRLGQLDEATFAALDVATLPGVETAVHVRFEAEHR